MNIFDALNLIAIKGALHPDAETNMRFVCRWYSKTFHTPLHVVFAELPVEDIWLAYFEERYREMNPIELEEYKELALESKEERAARLLAEEKEKMSESEFLNMAEKMAKPTEVRPTIQETKSLESLPKIEEGATIEFLDEAEMSAILAQDRDMLSK